MGIAYRTFQHLAIEALEWGRDKGKIVDSQNVRERQNKLYREARDMVDYDALDKHWENLLQESWDQCHDITDGKKKKHEVL